MSGYVYITTNKRDGTLYIGVSSDLVERMRQHKSKEHPGFTKKYNADRLAWFETHPNIVLAIKREKALKRYKREWKLQLIEELNPEWLDLTELIYDIENPYRPKPGSRWEADYI